MQLTIESTTTIEIIDGVPCRLWAGKSDRGVPVKVWIHALQPQTHDPEELAPFDAELIHRETPSETEQPGELLEQPDDWPQQSTRLIAKVRPLFAGVHPGVQGSALAYLTALWVMGHQCTAEMHAVLLEIHVNNIRNMLPIAGHEIVAIKESLPSKVRTIATHDGLLAESDDQETTDYFRFVHSMWAQAQAIEPSVATSALCEVMARIFFNVSPDWEEAIKITSNGIRNILKQMKGTPQ